MSVLYNIYLAIRAGGTFSRLPKCDFWKQGWFQASKVVKSFGWNTFCLVQYEVPNKFWNPPSLTLIFPNFFDFLMDGGRGSHGLNARRTKSRGLKGLQLEVGARGAPRLLVF